MYEDLPTYALPPPHSIEAEQSVLGALLLDGAAIDKIEDFLTDADFYRDDHRRIFRHIKLIVASGQALDAVTLYGSIERSNEVDQTGGLAYLGEIANATPSAANIQHYAKIIRERARLRSLILIADGISARCFNPGGQTAADLMADAENQLIESADDQHAEPAILADVFAESLAYIDSRADHSGLMTGHEDFDRLTCGLEPGQLIVLAARPSVGKTVFACGASDHLARAGKSVLFHSLEMNRRQIGMRIMAARTSVSVHSMRAGKVPEWDWSKIAETVPAADGQKVWIDDRAAVSAAYVRTRAKRMRRKHGLDLIVIDHLGLMTGGRGESRAREVGSITKDLKALAKELQVPILLLVQLNRGVEGRQDKRPMAGDLRDSGEIEEDADIIAMLHRESLYSKEPRWEGFAELFVRKNKDGPVGEVLFRFEGATMTLSKWEGDSPRPVDGAFVPKRFRDE